MHTQHFVSYLYSVIQEKKKKNDQYRKHHCLIQGWSNQQKSAQLGQENLSKILQWGLYLMVKNYFLLVLPVSLGLLWVDC